MSTEIEALKQNDRSDADIRTCSLCPRNCRVDRLLNKGICGVSGERILAARAALHFWEEPCISGKEGSGTVFFSGCNLHCVYCQNREISGGKVGKEITVERLSDIFLELQEKGARNINLVTPTHYADRIIDALRLAKGKGLCLPIVYNTSGYETVEAIDLLAPYVDIYLTDFKYMENELAKNFSNAEDYPEVAARALSRMVKYIPDAELDENGMMKRGVIVRHLLLPGHVRNAKAVIKHVYENYGDHVYLSLMSQYTPIENNSKYPELQRKVTKREYNRLLEYVLELGVTNAFVQGGKVAEESFIPSFNCEGV